MKEDEAVRGEVSCLCRAVYKRNEVSRSVVIVSWHVENLWALCPAVVGVDARKGGVWGMDLLPTIVAGYQDFPCRACWVKVWVL